MVKALNTLDEKFGISLAQLKCSAQAILDAFFAVILSTKDCKETEIRLLKNFLMGLIQHGTSEKMDFKNLKEGL